MRTDDSRPLMQRRGQALGRRAFLLRAGILSAMVIGSGASARQLDQGSIADTVGTMKPGDYLWVPEASPVGPVLIIVSLQRQRAYVYRNGVLIGISTVSTGAEGHETPTGIFTILQKRVDHKSNLYNDAPMPYMQRLTWDGVAMHAGHLPGYPASHGCIRLPQDFAKRLFSITELGMTVVVTREAEVPRFAPEPDVLAKPEATRPDKAADEIMWRPERSPTGPVSIIISTSDKRIVVLRNGLLIGSAPVTIKSGVRGLHAFTLTRIEATGARWLRVPLLGQRAAGEVTAEERRRITLPESFRQGLAAILETGSSLIVTTDTLLSASTGSRLTVMAGQEEP